MKKFFKHANRGVILAIVAVLCVAVYVLVDNARFKEAKPEIEQAVRQYMEEIKTVNLAAPQERIARTQELLEKYWTESQDNGYYFGYTKEDVRNYLAYRERYAANDPEIVDYTEVLKDISISQNGPKGAKIRAGYSVRVLFRLSHPETVRMWCRISTIRWKSPCIRTADSGKSAIWSLIWQRMHKGDENGNGDKDRGKENYDNKRRAEPESCH